MKLKVYEFLISLSIMYVSLFFFLVLSITCGCLVLYREKGKDGELRHIEWACGLVGPKVTVA
jgi:heme/copper-type cytochrome/quinol oxidase subunit 2